MIRDIEIGGRIVTWRRMHNAKVMRLRLDVASGALKVTTPWRTSEREVGAFVSAQKDWIAASYAALPVPAPFADGTVLPLRGENHVIRATGGVRGLVTATGGEIRVPGLPEHLSRRLYDYLINEARADLSRSVERHANTLEVTVVRIRLNDARTRWGSCSIAGNLNFNWRLILAPSFVLEYVAAHEVAHLKEMNHSSDFWALVAQLVEDVDKPRRWIKSNGTALRLVG
ncbi:MAG: SprT family zinc-dependent metalloprotease [Pseudomonadota bacterium]|nr:SprT family zinc-dependent metalloprotease [Pseudomonadota bacterium]